jgi:hypothetical protein
MRRLSPALLVDVVLVLAACVGLAPLVTVLLARRTHPFDLEWMEGGMLAHAWRLARGMSIYVDPSTEFIPYVYPPGYPALLALLGGTDGVDYALGRTVSGASTIAAAAALAVAVARVAPAGSRAAAWGVASAAAFLLAYPDSGAFYDLVRADTLALALLGWSIAAVVGDRPARGGAALEVVGGLLLFAAFTVKHNAAAFGVPLALGLWARDGWRSALRFGLAAAAPGLLFTLLMQAATDGRFVAYILSVPGAHPTNGARIFPGTPWELTRALPVPVTVGAAWLWWTAPRYAPIRRVGRYLPIALAAVACVLFVELDPPISWLPTPSVDEMDPMVHVTHALLSIGIQPVPGIGRFGIGFSALGLASLVVGLGTVVAVLTRGRTKVAPRWILGVGLASCALVVGALMRGHHGGFINVFMPMHWTFCLVGGAALARARGPWWTSAAVVAAVGQIAWGASRIEVEKLSPRPGDVEKGKQVVAMLRDMPGPVLSPYAPWLPVQAGHEPSFHLIALWDVDHEGGPFYADVARIKAAVQAQHWATIVDASPGMAFGVPERYRLVKRLPLKPGEFAPRTGWRATPARLLAPKPPRPARPAPKPASPPRGPDPVVPDGAPAAAQ